MATEFDFRDPLAGISLPELEEDEEEQKQQEQEQEPFEFDFENPLRGMGDIPVGIGPANINPLGIAEGAIDIIAKPIAAYNYEANQRYPDAFWDTWKYTLDAASTVPANLADRAKQAFESIKLQQAERVQKQLSGEMPMMLSDGTYDYLGQAFAAQRYANMSEEEKRKDKEEIAQLRNDTIKITNDLNKQIRRRQNDAELGEYGRTVSSGLESMAVITAALGINTLSGGRLTAPTTAATLGYFGIQTQAISYTEARSQGLSHEDALAYGNIQGLLEVGTEALPVYRYLRPLSKGKVSEILKDGFINVAADTSTEVLNGVLQEVNTAFFDLQSDLKTALDNANNPLYDGPTPGQVLQDIAGHSFLASLIASGSISSVRSTGEVIYSQEVKDYIRDNKDDPGIETFVNNFNTLVNNSSLNYEAIDKATVKMLDPNYNKGVTADELIAESFVNTNFIRITDPVQGVIDIEKKEGIVNQVNEKFPEEVKNYSFEDPLGNRFTNNEDVTKVIKTGKTLLTGEDIQFGSREYEQTIAAQKGLETMPQKSLLNSKDQYNQDELDIVRNRIIFPRRFHDGVLKDLPQKRQREFYLYMDTQRDMTLDESENLTKATVDLLNTDLPLDIFTDLRFIGVNGKNPNKSVQPLGQYSPLTQSILLNPYSGLKTADYKTKLGAKALLRSTFAHELAHHIDFGMGRINFGIRGGLRGANFTEFTPATPTSPLFDLPDITDLDANYDSFGYLAKGNGGDVMREAVDMFDKSEVNGVELPYFEGSLLKYPLNEYAAYILKSPLEGAMTKGMQDYFKTEVFAQMYSLYYTNRDFLRDAAPETYKLIERLNNAISADSFTAKNQEILRALQSPRASRGPTLSFGGRTDPEARRVDRDGGTATGVAEQSQQSDRDNLGPEVPRLNSTALLDFIKQNPEGFTVDPTTLESPSSGFAVAPVKALEIVLDQNKMDEDVARQFAKNVADLAKQIDKPVFAGGWLNQDNGKYYLDATVVFDTIEDALYTAEASQQEAIFDLGTFNETTTEQGIKELKQDGRYSDQARNERRANIQELGRLFEETRNRSSQEIAVESRPLPDLSETITVPEVASLLTEQDGSILFQAFSTFQELAVDKLDRLKYFSEKLKPYLPDNIKDLDIIKSTDTFHGKVKYGLDAAVEETDVLLKFLKSAKVKLEEFNIFLKNLHAPERNAHINKKYEKEIPELEAELAVEEDKKKQAVLKGKITKRKNVLEKYKDSGSGINTETAVQNLKEFGVAYDVKTNKVKATTEKGKNLLEAFKMLESYQAETRKIYQEQDLVSEETIADWDSTFKYYVPLVGFAVNTIEGSKPESSGGGRSLYGPVVPEAKGRTTESGSPFEQAVIRRQQAVVLGERNAINKELASLIRAFPDDKIWKVRGAKKFEKPQRHNGEEALIPFKEGGKTQFLVIKDARLAEGLHHWGNQNIGHLLGFFRGITGLLSSLYTSLNPEFVVGNFFRDYQTGYFNLLAEKEMGRAMGMKLSGALSPKNMVKILKETRQGYITGSLKRKDPEAFELFDAFRKYGGQTGYINAKDVDQIEKEMRILSRAHDGLVTSPRQIFRSTLGFVENVNNAVENAARFAVFKAYVQEKGGVNEASDVDFRDAAALAKNLTINFNRTGRLGPLVNSFYVFANASVQGSVNFFRGMVPFRFDKDSRFGFRFQKISRAKSAVMTGAVGLGAMIELYNTMVSGEDEDGKLFIDKIPRHEKERFLIVMLPGVERGRGLPKYNKKSGKYEANGKPVALAIPLPYGYNMFFNMGRMGVELGTSEIAGYDRTSPVEIAKDLAGIGVGSFSPVGVGYNKEGVDYFGTAVPSFLKPIYDVQRNQKWTGAPVYKEQFYGSKMPRSSTKLRNTEEFYREFTQMINKGFGGGEADAGDVNISPDTLKYYMESYLGGLYTTTMRAVGPDGLIAKGIDISQGKNRELTLNEIPFLRIVTAEPENYTDAQEYYRHKEFLVGAPNEPKTGIVTSYKSYREAGDKKALQDFIDRKDFKPIYLKIEARLKATEKQLTKLRDREKLAEKLRKTDEARYFDIIAQIEEERNMVQQRFNKIARQHLPKY